MIFDDGSGFHELAKNLIEQAKSSPNQDSLLRTAVSRGYYAVFLKARYHLKKKERLSIPSTPEAHTIVREKFKDGNDSVRNGIFLGLKELRNHRNQADYNTNYVATEANLKLMMLNVNSIMSDISSL